MQSSSWQQAVNAVAQSLVLVLPQSGGQVEKPSMAAYTAAACLMALRDNLPDGAWEYVPVAVEVLMLAG